MSKQVCPVCGGRGQVELGFYENQPYGLGGSTSTPMETCRTCGGLGVIEDD